MFQVEFMIRWLNKVIDLIYAMMGKKKKKHRLGGSEAFPEVRDCPNTTRRRQTPPLFLVVGTRWVVMPWKHGSESSNLPTRKSWQHDKAPLNTASSLWLIELIRIEQVALRIKEASVGSDQSRIWITDWQRRLWRDSEPTKWLENVVAVFTGLGDPRSFYKRRICWQG